MRLRIELASSGQAYGFDEIEARDTVGAANSQFERKSKTFTSSEIIGYIQCD